MSVLKSNHNDKPASVNVLRVTTSYFTRGNKIVKERSIVRLKRLSQGCDAVYEEVMTGGVESCLKLIKNFDTVKDGIYCLSFINLGTDPETGHCDDYEFKLVPFTKEKEVVSQAMIAERRRLGL